MPATTSVWPSYRGFAIRDLPTLLRFVVHPTHLRNVLTVVALLCLYVAGLFIPIPGVLRAPALAREPWWFLTLLDFVLTGGALGRGSIFSMGLLGPLILGRGAGKRHAAPWAFLSRGIVLALVAALIAVTFRAQGLIGRPYLRWYGVVWVALFAGGIAVKFINGRLLRQRGPAVLYVNLFITAFVSLRALFVQFASAHQYMEIGLVVGSTAFIAISSYFVMRSRISIEVQNIRRPREQRNATLEISTMDEEIIDGVGALCLMLYVCMAGLISLALGWRTLALRNYPALGAISVVAFALVWAFYTIANGLPALTELTGESGIMGSSDPRGYALRMLNNFWIIPNQSAGRDTEAFIKSKMAAVMKRSFLVFASWLAIMLVIQYEVTRRGSPALLFPYGPLVPICILVMLTGNISMILRHLALSMNHFKQLLRGQSRVLSETYPLTRPDRLGRISLGAEFEKYWEEEKTSEQLSEIFDWFKLAREVQLVPIHGRISRASIGGRLLQLSFRVVAGVAICFIVGAVCVLLFPDITRKDLGLVLVPLFVPIVFGPETIVHALSRIRRR